MILSFSFFSLSLASFLLYSFTCLHFPSLVPALCCFGFPLSRSLSSIFSISLTLSRTHSKLAHSLTYSLIRSLSYFMLTCLSFLVLPPSLNYFSLTHWLSFPLIHSLALAPCLHPSLVTTLVCSVVSCFLHSFIHALVYLFVCFVPDSLSHSLTFFLFFPHSLARPTASFRIHSLTSLLACSCTHWRTPLLLSLPLSFTHSLARSRAYSFAFFLLTLVTELAIGLGPLLDFSKKVCSLGLIIYPSRDPIVTLIALSRLHTSRQRRH